MNEQDKIIEEQLSKMPANLRQAIKSTAWEMVVQEVANSFKLNAEQSKKLEQETTIALYGFDNPSNLSLNIAREVGVPEALAEEITEDLVNKIFLPIQKRAGGATTSQPQGISNPTLSSSKELEVAPEIHPMTKSGEVARTVPHVEQSTPKNPPTHTTPTPHIAPSYPGGKDPYREPLS